MGLLQQELWQSYFLRLLSGRWLAFPKVIVCLFWKDFSGSHCNAAFAELETRMTDIKLNCGDVVWAHVSYGGRVKPRPCIVIEVKDNRAYLLLGSSQNLVPEVGGLIVKSLEDLRTMGLPKETQFHWGREGDQWVDIESIAYTIGTTPERVVKKVGEAWAQAKFNRLT